MYEARTLEFKENILLRASKRNDEWVRSVSTRVHSVFYLVTAEAKYHEECRVDFFLCDYPKCPSKRGRSEDETKLKAFQELCSHLDENDECQYSLTVLLNFMNERLDDYNSYTATH